MSSRSSARRCCRRQCTPCHRRRRLSAELILGLDERPRGTLLACLHIRQKCSERSYTLLLMLGAGSDVGAEKTEVVDADADENAVPKTAELGAGDRDDRGLSSCLSSSDAEAGHSTAARRSQSKTNFMMPRCQVTDREREGGGRGKVENATWQGPWTNICRDGLPRWPHQTHMAMPRFPARSRDHASIPHPPGKRPGGRAEDTGSPEQERGSGPPLSHRASRWRAGGEAFDMPVSAGLTVDLGKKRDECGS